jgi:hypothetical protein
MREHLEQIKSAAENLAKYIRSGNVDVQLVKAEAALIHERAQRLDLYKCEDRESPMTAMSRDHGDLGDQLRSLTPEHLRP